MNINASNLTQEEQAKLMNITNLQNSINNNFNNPLDGNSGNDNRENKGEKNLKRDLSDREKAELELKRWNKEQKKVYKYDSFLINIKCKFIFKHQHIKNF